MNLLDKIKGLITKAKKNNSVLIKSKFGIPSVRVCGVVLVDNGSNFCPISDASQPCLASDGPGQPCTLAVNIGFRPSDLPEKSQIKKKSITKIFFGGNNLDFKSSIIEIAGVEKTIFGKVLLVDQKEMECTYVEFDSNTINPLLLIKTYNFVVSEEKRIFCELQDQDQIKYYEDLLASADISIPISQFQSFQY